MNELTKTEREIAVAQIMDRLTRYVKAIAALEQRNKEMGRDKESAVDDESIFKIAKKYEIPQGVCLMTCESYGGTYIEEFRPWVRRWVSGSLTEADVRDINFYFDVLNEFDHCWIFMDKPSYYYGGGVSYCDGDDSNVPEGFDLAEQLREWASVGTRSATKYRGRSFAATFLNREGYDSVSSSTGMAVAESLLGTPIDTRVELTRNDGKKIRVPKSALQPS